MLFEGRGVYYLVDGEGLQYAENGNSLYRFIKRFQACHVSILYYPLLLTVIFYREVNISWVFYGGQGPYIAYYREAVRSAKVLGPT